MAGGRFLSGDDPLISPDPRVRASVGAGNDCEPYLDFGYSIAPPGVQLPNCTSVDRVNAWARGVPARELLAQRIYDRIYVGATEQQKSEAIGALEQVSAAIARGDVGFLDDVIGGFKKAIEIIPTVVPAVAAGVQAVRSVQDLLNGGSGMPAMASQAAAMAAMMAMGGGAATTGSDGTAAFAALCNSDPTGTCQRNLAAALSGGMAGMVGGGMTPGMLNGDVSEADLLAAGIPAALVMALRGGGAAALNALRGIVPGLALTAGGAAIGTALTTSLGGGGSAKFPRAIFVPDARGGVREYKYRGRPVLYSGDISAARRVVKVAKRARSARGGTRRKQSAASQILMLPAGRTACGKCGNGACSGC